MSKRPTTRRTAGPTAKAAQSDAERVARQLDAINHLLERSTRALAQDLPEALTPPQVRAMEVLVDSTWENPAAGLSLSELSVRLGLAHSTVSGIVDRLERRGLIRRTKRRDDRRYARIEITRPVREWLRQELPALRVRPLVTALDQASENERASLTRSLALLRGLLEAQARADQPWSPASRRSRKRRSTSEWTSSSARS
jgi:DNA-binding MarR family transcriptional regulator